MVDLAGFSVPYRQGVGCCLSDIKYIIDNVKFSGVPSPETGGGGEVGERREITIDIRDVDLTKSSMSSVYDCISSTSDAYPDDTFSYTIDVGSALISESAAVAAMVIGKKSVRGVTMYFIEDGKYGTLGSIGDVKPKPIYAEEAREEGGGAGGSGAKRKAAKKDNCVIWGPTCDGIDKVWSGKFFTDLSPGNDWIVFNGVGCDRGIGGTAFNGFDGTQSHVAVRGWQ